MLRNEIKRAVFSKMFLAALVLMSLFSVLSALYYIEIGSDYNPGYIERGDNIGANSGKEYAPDFPIHSLFSAWLGGDVQTLAYTAFFFLFPIGTALPFSWSYYTEQKSGYIKNVLTRTSKKKYYLTKTAAVFISGTLVALVPYIINILMVSSFIPYYYTWAGYVFYNRIYFGAIWSDIFYSNPALHMLLFVLLNALYGGLFALLSYAVSFYSKNILATLFAPFLGTLALGYIEEMYYISKSNDISRSEINPVKFLHSRSLHYLQNPQTIFIVTAAIILFVILTVCIRGKKHEVY